MDRPLLTVSLSAAVLVVLSAAIVIQAIRLSHLEYQLTILTEDVNFRHSKDLAIIKDKYTTTTETAYHQRDEALARLAKIKDALGETELPK